MPSISLRPAVPEDEPFLQAMYHALRREEFQILALPEEELSRLLEMQYRAQVGSYAARFPNSSYQVVLVDGEPAGRIWVDRQEDEIRIVDVVLDANQRKKGTGTVLVQRLQEEARLSGLPIRATVDRCNLGSLRFHLRLGFQIVKEERFDLFVEWKPTP
jgi:GNAT superfamily N-acetyltransferase